MTQPRRGFSTTALKSIALVSMLIDHIGAVLVPVSEGWYLPLRIIGRIAFPLFCFCVAQGLIYTRDRGKYIIRLMAFAALSEIPFNLAIGTSAAGAPLKGIARAVNEGLSGATLLLPEYQNVIWTFLFAAVGITVFEAPQLLAAAGGGENGAEAPGRGGGERAVRIFVLAVCAALGSVMKTDYGWFGVVLVYIMYFLSARKRAALAAGSGAAMLLYGLYTSFYFYGNSLRFSPFNLYMWTAACAALIPIFFYSSKKGKGLKWLFYVFYPAHLLALFLIYALR